MRVLAIETSCDDTGAAVVLNGRKILSNVVSSQISVHQKYGGVVPELASRKHIEAIVPMVNEALERAGVSLKEIDGIAVTQGPGLVGSLLVGLSFAKSLSFASGAPLIGVNHIEAHLSAIFLEEKAPRFPFIGLVVSGGHTSLFRVDGFGKYIRLGQTRDDAAGEAFDKVAKLLGLGYPGGPIIDELSMTGNPKAIRFPRASLGKDSFDFSFSGVKTAVVNFVKAHPAPPGGFPEEMVRNIVSSFQEAVVDVLVKKTFQAAQHQGLKRVVLSGGVAANRVLRQRMEEEASKQKIRVHIPSPAFCTDNAAMVGVVGYEYLKRGVRSPYSLNAFSNLPL
ncbi:MAG: tRNA (adenosine(37)-N6)-threonylcarbamoyltransferase complex transferase subunit TsaD [Deltaproteobacteria bacterium RBG_16_49_23]|nr:MAG: tRNA (adenosine(37)-N6)-threonylcarbamoyltransferase complex transferase subunit TsaD [Deltaproteobacteria bacterium RBG_16_49_23]